EILELLGERSGVSRYRGLDHGGGNGRPVPVVIVRGALPEMAEPLLSLDEELPVATVEEPTEEELLGFDDTIPMAQVSAGPAWPSVGWEQFLLETARHPALPAVVETFTDGNHEYLIEEVPEGRSLWDAWDDPDSDAHVRYGWLVQIAEGLQALHR